MDKALEILEQKLQEMIRNDEWTLSRNDLNDLIDLIAFGVKNG